ncbi:MAG: hypothetical protein LH481_09375 [Burkholderiales bacterium]|nr:hypothetical protein [Burkholderiales bacterium]
MKIFRKLLLIWMICWLPAAGALAAVMPLSGSMRVGALTDGVVTDDLDMAAMPCHGKAMSGKLPFGQGCTHCVLCHLAGALATPQMPVIAELLPTHLFTASLPVSHTSFVPELISPPPRSLAV